jgi:hypothetical protein
MCRDLSTINEPPRRGHERRKQPQRAQNDDGPLHVTHVGRTVVPGGDEPGKEQKQADEKATVDHDAEVPQLSANVVRQRDADDDERCADAQRVLESDDGHEQDDGDDRCWRPDGRRRGRHRDHAEERAEEDGVTAVRGNESPVKALAFTSGTGRYRRKPCRPPSAAT